MNEPLVSIVIPTYKRPELVLRAVKSALNQSYNNIEVIVVDDNELGSDFRKQTKKLLSTVNDIRLNYVELKNNKGGCHARNFGLEISKGKYINFLDDDDYLYPEKIEKQVEVFINSINPLAVVGCFANIVDENGRIYRKENERIRGDVYQIQLEKNICTTSIALVDKEICIKAGGFTQMPSSQDHYFFIKVFSHNHFYDYVDEYLLDINHHAGERVSSNSKKVEGAELLFEKVKPLLQDFDVKDKVRIEMAHYNNIAMSKLSLGKNEEARKTLLNSIGKYKKINLTILKYLLFSCMGLSNFYRIKGMFVRYEKNSSY